MEGAGSARRGGEGRGGGKSGRCRGHAPQHPEARRKGACHSRAHAPQHPEARREGADGGCGGSVGAMAGRGKLLAVLGDEDTVTGFLLGGVGELDKHRKPNFLVVEKETSITEIEETFRCGQVAGLWG